MERVALRPTLDGWIVRKMVASEDALDDARWAGDKKFVGRDKDGRRGAVPSGEAADKEPAGGSEGGTVGFKSRRSGHAIARLRFLCWKL